MKHTFVICAYKESPYLEECIKSLKEQTVESNILLSTATPSMYLKNICEKYDVAYRVRDGKPEISADWNYGLSIAETAYVTLAHQDDIYEPQYVEKVLQGIQDRKKEAANEPSIIFADYCEILNGQKNKNSVNLKIKKILLFPLRNKKRQDRVYSKRAVLRFGNAIGCPTVTYNMRYIDDLLSKSERDALFETHFRSNLDWEAWEWLSSQEGAFLYIPEVLMGHRIHAESETSAVIQDEKRTLEDFEMFCKFWPGWFAKIISRAYKKSEHGNKV